MIKKYLKLWKLLAILSAGSILSNRIDFVSYLFGKFIRFGFFFAFILAIFAHSNSLAGYGKYEVIFFFLTFNIVDTLGQLFFRGIYDFRNEVRLGNFDYTISKPVNALFFSLSRAVDLIDFIFLIPIVLIAIYVGFQIGHATIYNIFAYIILLFFGLFVILGIHIISAALIVWKTEAENAIWLYRESMTIGRFPPEIFSPKIKFLFTYFMPIIIIISIPAKAFLNMLNPVWILISFLYASLFLGFSVLIWRRGLRHYSSASS